MSVEVAFVSLGSLLAFTFVLWLLSLLRHDASIIDIGWSLCFLLVSWVYYSYTEASTTRHLVLLLFVHLWGIRLSIFLLLRSWRKPEDPRYRRMRERGGESFWWMSLLKIFWFQAFCAWLVSMPIAMSLLGSVPLRLSTIDWFACFLVLAGLVFEAGSDWQLKRFKDDPLNQHKVCDIGLWRYSRHPNYFGESLICWGFFVFSLAAPGNGWTIASPLLMTWLLLRVSGVSMLEAGLINSKAGYPQYVARTNAFVPWFPRR